MSLKYGSQNDRWHKNFKEIEKIVAATKQLPDQKTNKTLYQWLVRQRERYYLGRLCEKRKEKLSVIGVRFTTTDFNAKWELNYSLLVNFLREYGRWPLSLTIGFERKLYVWCQMQRQVYTGSDKRRLPMPQYRIEKLEQINFCWSSKKKHEQFWNEKFQELSTYIQRESAFIPTKLDNKPNKLYSWLSAQRKLFRTGRLREDRLWKLNGLGFLLSTSVLSHQ